MSFKAQDSPPQGFDEIVHTHRQPIYNYLLRMTENPSEAEDLTQETFIHAYKGFSSFRGDSSLSTWLYRIASNTFYDHVRRSSTKQAKTTVPIEEAAPIEDTAPAPEQAITRAEMSSCVQGNLSALPEKYRTVLVMSDFQDLKNREIAEILEVSLDTVKIRLHRARRKFREVLNCRCDLSHDSRNVLVCEPKETSNA